MDITDELIQALIFYADPLNYQQTQQVSDNYSVSPISIDFGSKARKILDRFEENDN